MKCPLCGRNLIEFSSKYMDGCVLVCSGCHISSPYSTTITVAKLAFRLVTKEVRDKAKIVEFDHIDFGERMPDLGSHGEEDSESFANEPGGDVPYDKEPGD